MMCVNCDFKLLNIYIVRPRQPLATHPQGGKCVILLSMLLSNLQLMSNFSSCPSLLQGQKANTLIGTDNGSLNLRLCFAIPIQPVLDCNCAQKCSQSAHHICMVERHWSFKVNIFCQLSALMKKKSPQFCHLKISECTSAVERPYFYKNLCIKYAKCLTTSKTAVPFFCAVSPIKGRTASVSSYSLLLMILLITY